MIGGSFDTPEGRKVSVAAGRANRLSTSPSVRWRYSKGRTSRSQRFWRRIN